MSIFGKGSRGRVFGGIMDGGPLPTYYDQVVAQLGAANIVAHYRLDETSGTTAADATGNGYDGTLENGVTIGAASLLTQGGGTSFNFDGVNDYVNLGNAGRWDFIPKTGVFTVSGWVNLAGDGTVDYIISSGVATFRSGVSIRVTSTALDAFFITGGVQHFATTALPADGTHHIVFTADGSTATLYVDGVSVDTAAITPNAGDALSADMYFAQRSNNSGYWPGGLDEVTFADVTVTPAQVGALYNYGTT